MLAESNEFPQRQEKKQWILQEWILTMGWSAYIFT